MPAQTSRHPGEGWDPCQSGAIVIDGANSAQARMSAFAGMTGEVGYAA